MPITADIIVEDDVLTLGDDTTVTVAFSQAVTGLDASNFTFGNGTLGAFTTSDNITWTLTFTPFVSVTDSTNVITLDMTSVQDTSGNAGAGTATSNSFALDTQRPGVSLQLASNDLAAGETLLVTVVFTETVIGFGIDDFQVDNGTLSNLASDDGIRWTATLTPNAEVVDASNLITLDGRGFTDIAGNPGGGPLSANFTVSTVRPTVTVVVEDAMLEPGETAPVTITFSEAVSGFDNTDVAVENGTLSNVSSTDGGVTWTAFLTPDAGVADATNSVILDNTGVVNAAGNTGAGTTDSNNYAIDTHAPPPEPAPPVHLHGTARADAITGNERNNIIHAGDGANTVTGGEGADTIQGGADTDLLQGNTGNDSLASGAGSDTVLGGQGDDALQGNTGNDLLFGDLGNDTVHGGQDSDTLQGGQGDDVVLGDNGDDVVRGGQGDDMILGGDGSDLLFGDLGSDTLTGGAGADTFHGFGGAGIDLVTDFHWADGDRVMLDPGTVYTVAQAGEDTVISVESGDQMILAGVQLFELSDGWIFGA